MLPLEAAVALPTTGSRISHRQQDQPQAVKLWASEIGHARTARILPQPSDGTLIRSMKQQALRVRQPSPDSERTFTCTQPCPAITVTAAASSLPLVA
jgi:hypothetical protein